MSDEFNIRYTLYTEDIFESIELRGIDEIDLNKQGVKWIDIVGKVDNLLVSAIVKKFDLHKLVYKNLLSFELSPKIVEFEDYLYIIAKTTECKYEELFTNQISFILFKDVLITLREVELDIFADIISTIEDMPNIRKNLSDDLLYFLLDLIVDNYFATVESIGERIEELEDKLLHNPRKEFLNLIYEIKRTLISMISLLYHMRNITGSLSKDDEFELINGRTIYYLRDVNDQIIQIIDIVETYRDISSSMLDTYLSSIGNKTNEVMKVLTIFSSIFIPLTFLAGVYGMNFRYFPELNWKYSYLGFWVICIIIIGLEIRYFKKKDWM
jgi:magnesium transporter